MKVFPEFQFCSGFQALQPEIVFLAKVIKQLEAIRNIAEFNKK